MRLEFFNSFKWHSSIWLVEFWRQMNLERFLVTWTRCWALHRQWDCQRETHWPLLSQYVRSQNCVGSIKIDISKQTGQISFSNSKPKRGYFHCGDVQISANPRCAIIDVIFVVSNNRPVSIYTIFCGQFRNWVWPFHAISFPKKFKRRKQQWTTKFPSTRSI